MQNIDKSFYDFVAAHKNENSSKLLLKYYGKKLTFSIEFAVCQVIARTKTSSKIPYFLTFDQFLFPDLISSEQASDERVAKYHASLIGTGKKVLDMTAGLGIDAMSVAISGNNVVACEINPLKYEALTHNAQIIGIKDFFPVCGNCVSFIENTDYHFDVIFIDPARRDCNNNRIYSLSDCNPDVMGILPKMLNISDRILIKASPLLDLTYLRKSIPHVEWIHVVCVKGECKEVLIDISKGNGFKGLRFVDLDDSGFKSDVSFTQEELADYDSPIADELDLLPGNYLYEPNAGLMKLSASGAICHRFQRIKRVAVNTAIYVSDTLYSDFPGRVLCIESIPDKHQLKALKGRFYNVVVRNYPIDASLLRKKLGVRDGTDCFIYAFRATSDCRPMICLASRIQI